MALSVPMKRDANEARPTIHQQISEVERALQYMRKSNCFIEGNPSPKEKALVIDRMEAALASLIYLRDNREAIVAAVQQSARTA